MSGMMKLRVRYNGKTKIIVVQDEPVPTIEIAKEIVKRDAFTEWGLDQDTSFDISLDGKTGLKGLSFSLSDAGIVSGDLIKLIVNSSDPNESGSHSLTTAPSSMSVSENDMPGTSAEEAVREVEEIPCFSPGPIFFRECDGVSAVPHLVQKIYENDLIQNEFQAICSVIHFMMRESGFYIEGINDHEDILQLLQPRIFETCYSHAAGGNLKLNLSCNPIGPFILVNSVVQPCTNTTDQLISLRISTKEFVESFNSSNKNSNAAAVLKNLSKLNRQLKETITHPGLNHMREELCLPPVHGLLALFPEILNYILSFLDRKSLVAMGRVNKALCEITSDDNLWRNLYIKDFRSHPIATNSSWKEMYISRYKREKERALEFDHFRRDYEREFPHPHLPPDPSYPPMFPQQPFGMIGGEHDLHPSFPYGPFANPNRRLPPTRPHPSNPNNPVPGSRFDPIYPGGAFRPGRGGGMRDPDLFNPELDGSGLSFPRRPGRSGFNRGFDFI